ncbi:LLM class flavin-dependent oxidoreductase [Nocardia rosealba]|uniref:LLM class flavin-dependent oxidoreductase n=1 Tax=Nocardia rosealba TaxID=2878563 RepID=UPI001CD9DD50|nr:LLM class flavin-dependent oxidoreductase [Nocardia rosealba]MCA2210684.1 LLM class flavin-dependent oxidoreductase [Nocardia rosealba]
MSALFLGIETPGTGTHPASWRRPDSRAEDLFTANYWTEVVTTAETLGFDAVFLPDSFALQEGGPEVVRGRLDAVAVAARTAPLTRRIGLVPQVPVTHTEPFHVSKAIAALDFASLGRAGWEVTVSTGATEAAAFGRKKIQDAASLWHEADEAVEVVTRLWDSWEDDAEIRDVPTGRFIDRDRLHYIDFEGDNFSVKGPAITPRSPQGQPIVTVRADDPASTGIAVHRADLIRITAPDLPTAAAHRLALRAAIAEAGRDPDAVQVLLDLPVHLADSAENAHADVAELDRWAESPQRPGPSAAGDQRESSGPDLPGVGLRHVGTVAALDDLLAEIARSGIDGVVLRPLALHAALAALTAQRTSTAAAQHPRTLRDRLGLPRPVSRYAAGAAL